MNMTPSEAVALVNELKPLVANEDVDVVFCVPAIDIIPAMEAAKGSNICIGAENMYYAISMALLRCRFRTFLLIFLPLIWKSFNVSATDSSETRMLDVHRLV